MIYTRKGDKGESEIFNGERFSKDNQIFEVLGILDELNSLIGICKIKSKGFNEKINDLKLEEILEKIQKDLFSIQSQIAGADKKIEKKEIEWLEENIDFIENQIPELKNFVVANGSELAVELNYIRSVIRRGERRIVSLDKKFHNSKDGQEKLNSEILIYINRLSDLFFVLFRFVNFKKNFKEKYF